MVGTGAIGNATSSSTVTVTNSGGTLRPGDLLSGTTTGTLTLNGNYSQQSGGILEIDLAGMGQGTTYDLLTVSGNTSLAGTLDVKLLTNFVPTAGEQFNFLTYGSLTGGFDSVVGLDPGYNYTVNLANGVGTLTVVAGVPESSTLISAALTLVTGGLLLRRRRPHISRKRRGSLLYSGLRGSSPLIGCRSAPRARRQ